MKHKDIKKRWTIVINTVQVFGLKLTFIYIADSSLNVYLPNMLHQLLPKKYNIQRINQTSWDRDSVNKGEKNIQNKIVVSDIYSDTVIYFLYL